LGFIGRVILACVVVVFSGGVITGAVAAGDPLVVVITPERASVTTGDRGCVDVQITDAVGNPVVGALPRVQFTEMPSGLSPRVTGPGRTDVLGAVEVCIEWLGSGEYHFFVDGVMRADADAFESATSNTAVVELQPSLEPELGLILTKTGAGFGSVTGTTTRFGMDVKLSCEFVTGATQDPCGWKFSNVTAFTMEFALEATPSPLSAFAGWSGACEAAGTAPECTITIASGTTATVGVAFAFALVPLSVERQGMGRGSVVSQPAGIECGETCSAAFVAFSPVTLRAMAAPGSAFVGWTGACTAAGAVPECTLLSNGAAIVSANFALLPVSLSVSVLAPSHGSVVSEPAGIACRATCSASFPGESTVRLRAVPDPGFVLAGWAGACVAATTSAECTVTLTADATVAALFTAAQPVVRCHVPRLLGRTLSTARRLLASADCRLGHVSRKRSRTTAAGRIAAQAPRPGVSAAIGTRVSVVVSTGRA